MTTLLLSNGAGVFVPFPEKQEAEDYSHSTGNSVVPQCEERQLSAGEVLVFPKQLSAGEVLAFPIQRSAGEVLAFPGPLLRADMQKDNLMRFIQEKRQECLLHLDEPQQQKSFFFWSIMEYFCNSNGKVMMSEIAVLLFSGYGLLRKKLGRVKNQEQWCLPLAKLLCSAAPEDQLREDIIKMGNDFAYRNCTYAAHICFVLAQMELGSYEDYQLIGCDSFSQDKQAMLEALERTEVYEYVLSLTSGFGQTCFQGFKFFYACELFECRHPAQALQYCETIAAEVIRCPTQAHIDLIKMLSMLSRALLDEVKNEEPKWLTKLQQLEDSYNEALPQFHLSQHIESLYTIGDLLGQGGFGSVYAGVRKTDGKQVAIKCVAKDTCSEYITIPGETQSLPLEVALMVMVSKPSCDNVVELLEWFETSEFFILVLERPEFCMDLYKYCRLLGGKLTEIESRHIIEQVVKAARHCCDHGVFHRDIKPENILIDYGSLKVKLIDFGCGDLLKDEVYTTYIGTPDYYPPELIQYGEYHAIPATIWSLGVVLYELVYGTMPFKSRPEIVEGNLTYPSGVSEECCMLISWCLEHDPENRPTFEEILNHKWFSAKLW